MARAKKQILTTSTIAAVEITAGPVTTVPQIAPRWREDTWSGVPLYSCRRCPFSTLDLGRIRSHRCELPTHAR